LNVDLLGDFLELVDPRVFNKSIRRRTTQRVGIVGRRDGLRVLVVFEDQPDDIVYRVDGLVDFVTPQDLVIPGVVNVDALLLRFLATSFRLSDLVHFCLALGGVEGR